MVITGVIICGNTGVFGFEVVSVVMPLSVLDVVVVVPLLDGVLLLCVELVGFGVLYGLRIH